MDLTWLRSFGESLKDPAHQRAYGAALSAFEGMRRDERCDPSRLETVAALAGAEPRALWEPGMAMLLQLASTEGAALLALLSAASPLGAERHDRRTVLTVLREFADRMEGDARETASWCVEFVRGGYTVEVRPNDSAAIALVAPGPGATVFLKEASPRLVAAAFSRMRELEGDSVGAVARHERAAAVRLQQRRGALNPHGRFCLVDPDTGEILDGRDLDQTVRALVTSTHPEVKRTTVMGALRISSGAVTITDPINHLHKQPLERAVPKGAHEVSFLFRENDPQQVGAVLVRFTHGELASVEPGRSSSLLHGLKFGVRSGIAALFDYREVDRASQPYDLPSKAAELIQSSLSELEHGVPGAIVALPRVRKWNVVLWRVPLDWNGWYSSHWALDPRGEPLALVVDFGSFS